jgi:hypothetical protein
MNDTVHEPTVDDEDYDWGAARKKLGAKGHDGSKKARQTRQKKLQSAVDRSVTDGRSLRSTGRTEHINWKSRPEIKALLDAHVPARQKSLWLEEAIIAKLREEGVEVPDA